MDLIALGHKARRGKGEVAAWLEEEYNFHVVRFADALREELAEAHIVYGEIEDPDAELETILKINGDRYGGAELHMAAGEWIKSVAREEDYGYNSSRWQFLGMPEGEKDRRLMQWYGTDFRRALFGDDYWINKLSKKLEQYTRKDCVVIEDMRFPNEAQWVKAVGGQLWRIDAGQPWGDTGNGDEHESEKALDDWTGWNEIIENNGSIHELRHAVNGVMAYRDKPFPAAVKIMQRRS